MSQPTALLSFADSRYLQYSGGTRTERCPTRQVTSPLTAAQLAATPPPEPRGPSTLESLARLHLRQGVDGLPCAVGAAHHAGAAAARCQSICWRWCAAVRLNAVPAASPKAGRVRVAAPARPPGHGGFHLSRYRRHAVCRPHSAPHTLRCDRPV
eukprot:6464385-Prymnesium_polylepis.1